MASDLLSEDGICHGFSTREGGVSTLPHTASLNVAEGHGDDRETVLRNIDILAKAVTNGALGVEHVVCAPQIHSDLLRYVTANDAGTGTVLAAGIAGDGFYTDRPGVLLLIRTADCVPLLLTARREDGAPLVAAVHAGWRGTLSGIAPRAVEALLALGGTLPSVKVAVGPCIHACCFQVQEDFVEAVTAKRGADFAKRHIEKKSTGLYCDLLGMHREMLFDAGLTEAQLDTSPDCTVCMPHRYHSHRAGKGLRGAMGALIGIP